MKVITVTALVSYLEQRIGSDPSLQNVLVEGEISNFSSYRGSGNWYFSLKDSQAQIRCVMFRNYNQSLPFVPKDGDRVIVRGSANVYRDRGELQLLVTAMKPSGIGELYLKYEQLKKKLEERGIFAESHKKPIPRYPFDIALITGRNTAARSDVLSTLARRWPVARITEYPVLVQGEQSAAQIIQALLSADLQGHDVILLVRGGGSIEDLWSFNDEALAMTIYQLQTPLITGVGHETDFTIADFVADLRAPTPTGAAERCAPDIRDVQSELYQKKQRLNNVMSARLRQAQTELKDLQTSSILQNPQRLYQEKQLRLDSLEQKLRHSCELLLNQKNQQIQLAGQKLLHLSQTSAQKARLQLETDRQLLKQLLQQDLQQALLRTQKLTARLQLQNPGPRCTLERQKIQALQNRLLQAAETQKEKRRTQLARQSALLQAYSPLQVLARGYSIVRLHGVVMKDVHQVHAGDPLSIRAANGTIEAVASADGKEEQ